MRAGDRLNHFEILSSLGRGGMGEVWKARDTRLQRDVALKTLPPEFLRDSDRLARLEREATLLAAVNHPNVATIHGIEEHGDERFLVLELVEGPTLANRLTRGRLDVRQALDIALQIARGLETAHEKGIVHRDLKPENIKLAGNGQVKVLDFGLAKDLEPSAAGVTQTGLTEIGTVMGTPAYMSPEQARGEHAGRQTDIWAFGAVLFEMLTGKAPFRSDTTAETVARVLEREPDYSSLPPTTPSSVRRLLRRCLEKDPKRRAQHIGDVRIEIEDALAGNTDGRADAGNAAPRRFGTTRALAVTLVALAVVAGVAAWAFRGRATVGAPAAPVRLSIASLPSVPFLPFGIRHIAISRDGARVAYAAEQGLMIRRLSEAQTVAVGSGGTDPFFSPDGEWVAYWNVNSGLYKVPSAGGPATQITLFGDRFLGADWSVDGTIVFATTAGLYRVSADGGDAEPLAKPNPALDEQFFAWPSLLPNGRSLLYTILGRDSVDAGRIASLSLESRESRILLSGGIAGTYVPTGHVVYAAQGTLHAIAFDPKTGTTSGSSVALASGAIAVAPDNGAAEFAVSPTGTLVSIAPAAPNAVARNSLVWTDRSGNEELLPLQPAEFRDPRVSPDGTRVAVDVLGGHNRDIWIWDLRRASFTQLTHNVAENLLPLWSVDGRRVFYGSNRAGNLDIYAQVADGSSEANVVLAGKLNDVPNSLTPDGKRLIVYEEFHHLGILDLETSNFGLLLDGPANDRLGEISPDGKWIAYESQEPGQQVEIYVRPFPNVTESREKVSIDGGRYPLWGRPGSNELYYVNLEGHMMAVTVELSPSLRLGATTKLFDWVRPPPNATGRQFDISPIDGLFIMAKAAADSAQPVDVSVVLNWFTELRGKTQPR